VFTTGGCGMQGGGKARVGWGIDGYSVVLVTRLHWAYGMHAAGTSEDSLQQVQPSVLERWELEGAVHLFQVPPPALPPFLDAPVPSLPLTARSATSCVGWASRPRQPWSMVELYPRVQFVPGAPPLSLSRLTRLTQVWLPLVLKYLEPEGAVQLFQVCKPPPSHPPGVDAPVPSLPLTVRPAHVLCWTVWITRESHQ